MARTTTRCSLCPIAHKKARNTMLMHQLFVEEAVESLPIDPVSRRQAQALREAIAPCKDERITGPADLAGLLMLELGHLDHEEVE